METDKAVDSFLTKYSNKEKEHPIKEFINKIDAKFEHNKDNPWLLPPNSLRDLFLGACIFTLCVITYKGIFLYWSSNSPLAEKIFALFSNTLTVIVGYYFGAKSSNGGK